MDSEESAQPPEQRRAEHIRQWIDLLSALLLATATVATAWCAYQSTRWGGDQSSHAATAFAALVRTSKFTNLAEQRRVLHVNLFGQWASASIVDRPGLADFLFRRFPEPLKEATIAWQATRPFADPSAPATPFEMPAYVLTETNEAQRWEDIAIAEFAAADRADEISDHYLVFTIIFASVLFFGGVSGKFRWQIVDVVVLAFGALTLFIGLAAMFSLPYV